MKKIYEKNAVKWSNEYYDNGECIILRCSKPETNETYDILIDYCDFEKVKEGQWYVTNSRKESHRKDIYHIIYSKRIEGKKYNFDIYQWILDTKNKNIIVDHINRNRFDNRRFNLRYVSALENSLNQDRFDTEYLGYRYEEKHDKYLARIKVKDKYVNIGRYDTEEEANEIYLKCCIVLGRDKVSDVLDRRIYDNNIIVSDEDMDNKYIIKVKAILEGKDIPKETNGKLNLEYISNMDLIVKLRGENKSWHYISSYLVKNGLMTKSKGETAKKYYNEYINNMDAKAS